MRRLLIVLVAALAVTGCALRRQQAQQLAEADALFARGCYRCLQQAFTIYDTLRQAGYQPANTSRRAFDTAILLAAREKELAMEAEGWIKTAEGLSAAAGAKAPTYLEIVRALPWAAGRLDRDQQARIDSAWAKAARPIGETLDAWEAALGPPAARPIAAAYLMISARCAFTPAREQDSLTVRLVSHPGAPLVRYAAGRCRNELRAHLDAVAGDPDFHEAAFERGRLRLYRGGATVHSDARVLLEATHQAMPEAVAATYLLAGVLSALGEYEACAAMYDEVVKAGGARRESMLSRTICLTHALKRQEAIATATELIDRPGILRGEGFFWRSWNRYHLKELPAARADVEQAKKSVRDADVYALSGFIAYDMEQRDYAYTEFQQAYQRSGSQYCVAVFYQGLIDSHREQWTAASDRYERATHCYSRSVANLERELNQVKALDPAEHPTRQRRLDNLTVAIDAERLQWSRAAYNTAYAFGRGGVAAKGIPFAEQAITAHQEMKKLAEELLVILRKSG